MPLLSLPIELLLHICSFFEHPNSINSLVRTCKRLQFMLTDALYKKGTKIIFSDGATALHRCCRLNCGLLPTHSLLLAGSAFLLDLKSELRFNVRSTTPLHQALLKQNMDVVELLLAFGSDSSHISRDDLIRQVCRDRNLYKHKNQHKNCDVEYRAFFLHAVATGKSEVVELLVDKVMVKPFFTDKDGFMPLHYAVKHGYPKIVTYLLSLAKLPSKLRHFPTIKTLFCRALTGGDDEVVRELLTTCPREVGLGEKLLTGETLLHIARTALSVTLLLGAGVNINTRDRHLRTPLHTAATAGRVEVVQALLARGALSRLWDGDGMTPLNRAVMAREWGVVKAMARAGRKWGVDVTLKDRCGMTAVEKARAAGLEEDSVTMKLLTNVPATQTPKKVRRKVSAPTVVMDAKVKKGSSAKGEKRRFKTGGVQTAG